jgi:hypothetical protein
MIVVRDGSVVCDIYGNCLRSLRGFKSTDGAD